MDRRKFKSLSIKGKIAWILEYYGIAIVVAIVVVIVGVIFIKSVFFPSNSADICALMFSNEVSDDEASAMEEEIEKLTNKDVEITVYHPKDLYGESSFSMKLSADQIDLVVAPLSQTEEMMKSAYLLGYEKIDGVELYIGKPQKARDGEELDKAYQYIMEYFK